MRWVGIQVVPVRSSARAEGARAATLSLSSICTKRPESGRFDHSALAVTWKSTIWPWPSGARVTSGVPSASSAITRSASRGSGWAMTCRLTVTSGPGDRPAKGEVSAKGARARGSPQLIAPPTLRPPARRRTGRSGSASAVAGSSAASRGPAKRTSRPPEETQAVSASASGAAKPATSARMMTSGLAGRTSGSVPSTRSAPGASAWRR